MAWQVRGANDVPRKTATALMIVSECAVIQPESVTTVRSCNFPQADFWTTWHVCGVFAQKRSPVEEEIRLADRNRSSRK
jgi:hypothetical protein